MEDRDALDGSLPIVVAVISMEWRVLKSAECHKGMEAGWKMAKGA